MNGCGASAGPVWPFRVVSILAVRDGIKPMTGQHFIADTGEEFVFAVKAAIRAVGDVIESRALLGVHLNEIDPNVASDLMRRHALVLVGCKTG